MDYRRMAQDALEGAVATVLFVILFWGLGLLRVRDPGALIAGIAVGGAVAALKGQVTAWLDQR